VNISSLEYHKRYKMGVFATGSHPKKHYYKVDDIAKVAGRSVGTIRNASWSGKLDLDDLESVLQYCMKRRIKGKYAKKA